MLKKIIAVMVLGVFVVMSAQTCLAAKSSSDLLKEGLLGAGAGAVGGAASGAKGGDIWKGALAGAGVNIVGGALLDSISGEPVRSESHVQKMPSKDAYNSGYQDGYTNAYKAGYMEGYKTGIKEGTKAR